MCSKGTSAKGSPLARSDSCYKTERRTLQQAKDILDLECSQQDALILNEVSFTPELSLSYQSVKFDHLSMLSELILSSCQKKQ